MLFVILWLQALKFNTQGSSVSSVRYNWFWLGVIFTPVSIFMIGSCHSLSPKSMDRIVRMGRVKEEEPRVKYKTRMSDFAVAVFYLFCSLASDCLYTVAINQTIISVSNKKTSSCECNYLFILLLQESAQRYMDENEQISH